MIDKTATNPRRGLRTFGYFARARDAFGAALDACGISARDRVLLPAYIGWSPREGSGVFDPIAARNIEPVFYRMDARLHIDEADALCRIRDAGAKAILFIHYFGFVDPAFQRLAAAARAQGLIVVEDAAHALYSDMVGGICARAGDYTLYSLHKQLPFAGGGMLAAAHGYALPETAERQCAFGDPFVYDFYEIARARRENYRALRAALAPFAETLVPLWPELPDGVAPQTFPALVTGYDRFLLYRQLNEMGFGAVSLYHTLIEPLRAPAWKDSLAVSDRIINFPVHQDVCKGDYAALTEALAGLLPPAR